MKIYVLLQAPAPANEWSGQIEIIDDSMALGKARMERLLRYGYQIVGHIESDQSIPSLKDGFNSDKRKTLIRLRKEFEKFKTLFSEISES